MSNILLLHCLALNLVVHIAHFEEYLSLHLVVVRHLIVHLREKKITHRIYNIQNSGHDRSVFALFRQQ